MKSVCYLLGYSVGNRASVDAVCCHCIAGFYEWV